MSLRLIEVIVPRADVAALTESLAEQGALGVWASDVGEHQGLLRILLNTEATEAFTDELAKRFAGNADFRMMLFPVEATLPAPEPEEQEEDGAAAGEAEEEEKKEKSPLRISREELHQDLSGATRISLVYITTVALSTLVAAVGLMTSSVAVVIGAMVIAPLLGPNVALSLASTLGDTKLARDALKAGAAGAMTALVISAVAGLLLPVDPGVTEIATRTDVGAGDLVLALSAGAAGTLAFTQGLSTAVIGVMVAVALLPPLVAAGLLLGAGHLELSNGALLLAAVNVVCVNLAGVVTFLAQRVRPRTWWEAERASRATRTAVMIWIGMLLLLLMLIFL